MMRRTVLLRKLDSFCCTKFYHSSLKVQSKKKLVPEQFLNLADATRLTSRTGIKKTRTNYNKKRLEKRNVSKKEYLYGISPCLAALEASRRTFYTIYFNEDASKTISRPQFKRIKTLSSAKNVPTKSVSRKRLDDLSGNRPHQNVVMKVGNLSLVPLEEENQRDLKHVTNYEHRPPLWLILQGIQDPMNMGAILRTAVFLGVDKVVSSEYDSCSLSPAVSKASAGAMEALPMFTTNVKQLLKRKREEGYEILGTVGPYFVPQENSLPIVTINSKIRLEKPSLLVLGNEGKGLSIEIQNLCTKFLTIPVRRNTKIKELDSLNVSVATEEMRIGAIWWRPTMMEHNKEDCDKYSSKYFETTISNVCQYIYFLDCVMKHKL